MTTTAERDDTQTLYQVNFRLSDTFHGRCGVRMTLFRAEGDPPFEVSDYLPDGVEVGDGTYVEGHVRELFTREEADALADYFREDWPVEDVNVVPAIEETAPRKCMGVGAIPVGGSQDFYMFCEDERIQDDLPVPVWGYYDLRFGTRVETVYGLPDHLEPVEGDTLEKGTRVRVTDGEHQGREGVVADAARFVEVDLEREATDLPW